jgi:hypothetical protein
MRFLMERLSRVSRSSSTTARPGLRVFSAAGQVSLSA